MFVHPPRALSALAHWSAIFGETEYLSGLVFPFVKLCQNNQLVTFEILATLLGEPHYITVHLLLKGGGGGASSKFSFPSFDLNVTHTHTSRSELVLALV